MLAACYSQIMNVNDDYFVLIHPSTHESTNPVLTAIELLLGVSFESANHGASSVRSNPALDEPYRRMAAGKKSEKTGLAHRQSVHLGSALMLDCHGIRNWTRAFAAAPSPSETAIELFTRPA
nr:hypothetical protein CFP56_43854 [Quercus suber]